MEMTQEISAMRRDRYVSNNVSEFEQANHIPISGYENLPLMSLEEAVERIVPFVDNIRNYVHTAKQNCNRTSCLLTWDESAAIYLYTMPTSFFSQFNEKLRAEDRDCIRPYFAFLRLLMSALEKLSSLEVRVWRAVASSVGSLFLPHHSHIWWSVNSCSTAVNVVQMYLGETSTVFAISAIHGKDISEYSAFPAEQEVLLMPGTRLRVKSKPFNHNGLIIVDLEEERITVQNTSSTSAAVSFPGQPYVDSPASIISDDNDDDVPLIDQHNPVFMGERSKPCTVTAIKILCATVLITSVISSVPILLLSKKQQSTPFTTTSSIATPFTTISFTTTSFTIYTVPKNYISDTTENRPQETNKINHLSTTAPHTRRKRPECRLPRIPVYDINPTIVAGNGSHGSSLYELYGPNDVVLDSERNFYVADGSNHRILKYLPSSKKGEPVVGSGTDRQPELSNPLALFIDKNDLLYTVDLDHDEGHFRVISWPISSKNGTQLIKGSTPTGRIFVDEDLNIYTSAYYENQVLIWFAPDYTDYKAISTGRGSGSNQLRGPSSIYIDYEYNLFIADAMNSRLQKWAEYAKDGITVFTTKPQPVVAVIGDCHDNLYVIVNFPTALKVYNSTGQGISIIGNATNEANQFRYYSGLALDPTNGDIYATDVTNSRVEKFTLIENITNQ